MGKEKEPLPKTSYTPMEKDKTSSRSHSPIQNQTLRSPSNPPIQYARTPSPPPTRNERMPSPPHRGKEKTTLANEKPHTPLTRSKAKNISSPSPIEKQNAQKKPLPSPSESEKPSPEPEKKKGKTTPKPKAVSKKGEATQKMKKKSNSESKKPSPKAKKKKPKAKGISKKSKGLGWIPFYRSNLYSIFQILEDLKLQERHMIKLELTPFYHLFNSINSNMDVNYRKMDTTIEDIISCYDPTEKKFKLGGQFVGVTANDISTIFGIVCGNVVMDVKKLKLDFKSFGLVMVKDVLRRIVSSEKDEDVEDVARLLVLVALKSLFLSSKGERISSAFFHYVEDLNDMKKYDWSSAILENLLESLKDKHGTPMLVVGCVSLLPHWFFEHTSIFQPQREILPRFMKWDVSKTIKDFKTQIANLEVNQMLDAYLSILKERYDNFPSPPGTQKKKVGFITGLSMNFMRSANTENMRKYVDKVILKLAKEGTRFILMPIHTAAQENGRSFDHWTLLVFDTENGEYKYYNSLGPRTKNGNDCYVHNAKKMYDHVKALSKEALPKPKFIKVKTHQQRFGSLDCGIHVLMAAEDIFEKAVVSQTYEDDAANLYRAKIFRDIISHANLKYHF